MLYLRPMTWFLEEAVLSPNNTISREGSAFTL